MLLLICDFPLRYCLPYLIEQSESLTVKMANLFCIAPTPAFSTSASLLSTSWKDTSISKSYHSSNCRHSTQTLKQVPQCKHPNFDNPRSQDADMKGYLAKIRKRLRRSLDPTKGVTSRRDTNADSTPASLPDNLDVIDDMVMDRGPAQDGQVRVFGAWLDEDVAGRKAANERELPSKEIETLSLESRGKALFDEGMREFVRGSYPKAAACFQRAVIYADISTREGGEYQLWLAQSWDAAGDKTKALAALSLLATHGDGDVRKVGEELKFIMSAPRLKCDRNSFLEIPEFSETPSSHTEYILGKQLGLKLRSKMKHKPEKYSLEWYMEKPLPPKDNSAFDLDLVVLVGVLTAFGAFLASAITGVHVPVPAF
eukprot:Plantae.Rhodophyta-Hildenbrandia_rubra.ctg14828.p1 GENE.Plantae.Rhodophyta-Hildenbrandia_rubra.ctg14828~~Plantae.Rhodophyta-Hildenbrandia_rubra.ctg14828.p1  ORF type:complete len:370 (+),score=69.01 Plantae.Rhodophyta-Hildenbrandia_rubra.ctg14828:1140-2249(+)